MTEVRHLWNCLIAKLNSRNGSSSLAKSGTLDNFCIASILECVGKQADWYERETWQRSTIYQGKHSRTAQMAAFTKIQRKFHCLRILRSILIGVKQLPINSKLSSAPLSKQAAQDQKDLPSDVSPSKLLPPNEHLPRPVLLFVNASVHVQVEQET